MFPPIDIVQVVASIHDWSQSQVSRKTFEQDNAELLARVQYGTTFIPESYGSTTDPARALAGLTFLDTELHIKHIRFGIRWNTMQPTSTELSTVLYKPLLQYCFDHGISVTLSLGPIKSPGWPEQYVPQWVLDSLPSIPAKNAVITEGAPLATAAQSWLVQLLDYTEKTWSSEQRQLITGVQVENEAYNAFGDYRWTMSDAYLQQLVNIVSERLPGRKIVFNSAGRFNLSQIQRFVRAQADPTRFVLGMDYYYVNDETRNIPFSQYFNGNSLGWFGNGTVGGALRFARDVGCSLEVTEDQAEPWGRAIAPGNTLQSLQYVTLQGRRFLPPNTEKQSWPRYINLWGLDRFAQIFLDHAETAQHIEMKQLISWINLR
jgi:hypothetical protein